MREKDYSSADSRNWRDLALKYKGQSFEDAPKKVRVVICLEQDLKALSVLLGPKTPLNRLVRGAGLTEVVYGFGDASGTGFSLS